jgi:hypothetical protein
MAAAILAACRRGAASPRIRRSQRRKNFAFLTPMRLQQAEFAVVHNAAPDWPDRSEATQGSTRIAFQTCAIET